MKEDTAAPPEIPDHEVVRVIGRGAYGTIWLARSLTGTWRAVKVISRSTFATERSFQREFEGMASFEPISRTCQGFVHILHVGRGEGFFYYIMELADDPATGQEIDPATYQPKTVKTVLDTRSRLPARECIELGLSLASTLQALHDRDLTHRDIKPSNIIYVRGLPKIADIGLVAVSGQQSFVGTEGYVPPEGPGTPEADIFSLGKVLYEAAMGKDRLDFPEVATELDTMEDKSNVLELNEILLKACAARLKRRYASAREMRRDLLRLKRGRQRRAAFPFISIAVVLLLLAAGVFAALHSRWQSPPPPPPQESGFVAASLRIQTNPPDAMVTVDDNLQRSPCLFSGLAPGWHKIHIMLDGFDAVDQTVSLASGQKAELPAFALARSVGTLKITSDPPGASFVLTSGTDARRSGITPAVMENLPTGAYEIDARKGLMTATQTADVNADQTTETALTLVSGNGSVKITSSPEGATVLIDGKPTGITPILLEDIPPGGIHCQLSLPGFKDMSLSGTIEPQQTTFLATRLERASEPQPGKPWTNSLGMVFVPLGNIRMSVWDTRVRDFEAFCKATGRSAPAPDFAQTENDPVVLVSWQDATDFCQWLTEKERADNHIAENQSYRLPTDVEWSEGAGLPSEGGDNPESRDGKLHGLFPWGTAWPPPKNAGNYADQSMRHRKDNPIIPGYNDHWPQTSPVGTFPANSKGLYDMGGNVWQWCLEGYGGENSPQHDWGVLRGGSWATYKRSEIQASYRNVVDRHARDVIYGFRCVLEQDQ